MFAPRPAIVLFKRPPCPPAESIVSPSLPGPLRADREIARPLQPAIDIETFRLPPHVSALNPLIESEMPSICERLELLDFELFCPKVKAALSQNLAFALLPTANVYDLPRSIPTTSYASARAFALAMVSATR